MAVDVSYRPAGGMYKIFDADVTRTGSGSSWCRNELKETNHDLVTRPDFRRPGPQTLLRASTAIASSLDPALAHLVEIRASQINGCAKYINMHTVYARKKRRNRAAHLPAAGLARGRLLYPS